MIGRRELLKGAMLLAVPGILGLPGQEARAGAAAPAGPGVSQAGYYRMQVGGVEVVALSDGTLSMGTGVLHARPERVEKLLRASLAGSPVNASVNAYLIVLGERLVLVDAGTGELLGPTLNKLGASLRAAGYAPEQITDILATHIHTDHTGGLAVGGRPVFPNAVVRVERRELDYWLSPANREAAPEGHKSLFDGAAATVGVYAKAGKVEPFDGETELFPGLKSRPAWGHTPGHSFYVLESRGEKLVFWGDILHVGEVQFPEPGVTIDFDTDPKAAREQRLRTFAEAAREGYLAAGAHIAFPGVGRLAKSGAGYRWFPVPYVNDAVAPK